MFQIRNFYQLMIGTRNFYRSRGKVEKKFHFSTINWNYCNIFQNLHQNRRYEESDIDFGGIEEGRNKETGNARKTVRSISLPKTSSRVSSGSVQVEERRAQGGSSISAKIVEGEGGGRRTRGRTRKGGTRGWKRKKEGLARGHDRSTSDSKEAPVLRATPQCSNSIDYCCRCTSYPAFGERQVCPDSRSQASGRRRRRGRQLQGVSYRQHSMLGNL